MYKQKHELVHVYTEKRKLYKLMSGLRIIFESGLVRNLTYYLSKLFPIQRAKRHYTSAKVDGASYLRPSSGKVVSWRAEERSK